MTLKRLALAHLSKSCPDETDALRAFAQVRAKLPVLIGKWWDNVDDHEQDTLRLIWRVCDCVSGERR